VKLNSPQFAKNDEMELTKKKNSYTGIFPVRESTKQLPGENLRLLIGVALMGHTTIAALNTPYMECVLNSSDSE
jgi:CMP-N-acetylneuraminic acid synthetase